MQNIDPVYILQPLATVIIAFALVAYYWLRRKTMNWWILAYSLAAYGIAILIKVVFQYLTYPYAIATGNLYLLGLYFGLQTAILEVGFAYLFAVHAVRRGRLSVKGAGAYGIGLAFWENGVLLGLFSLVSIMSAYAVLSGNGSTAATVYKTLQSAQPSLFYPPSQAIGLALLGILERISSTIIHYAWGLLAVMAAYSKRKRYLLLALPMGLIDFIVPFAGTGPLYVFELVVFALSVISLGVAKWATVRR